MLKCFNGFNFQHILYKFKAETLPCFFRFPYPKWNSVFDQLQQVVDSDPPRLEAQVEGRDSAFTLDFVNFVNICLIKDEQQRPKYKSLLTEPFIKTSETETVNVAGYVEQVLDRYDKNDDVEMADL